MSNEGEKLCERGSEQAVSSGSRQEKMSDEFEAAGVCAMPARCGSGRQKRELATESIKNVSST